MQIYHDLVCAVTEGDLVQIYHDLVCAVTEGDIVQTHSYLPGVCSNLR